jgi:hypothetical protein
MSDAIARAGELLRRRINEIEAERRQLEQALSSLVGRHASQAAVGVRGRSTAVDGASRRRMRSGRRKVAPSGERRRQLMAVLKDHPPSRPSEIAKSLGVSSANVQNVLRKALNDGVVVKRDGSYSLSADSTKAEASRKTKSTASRKRTPPARANSKPSAKAK